MGFHRIKVEKQLFLTCNKAALLSFLYVVFYKCESGDHRKRGVGRQKSRNTSHLIYSRNLEPLLNLKIELLLCFHETALTARHTYDDLQPGVVEQVLFHHLLQREHLSVHDVRQPADAAGHPLPQE